MKKLLEYIHPALWKVCTLIALLQVLSLTGCVNESDTGETSTTAVEAIVSLQTNPIAQTRALGQENESAVRTLDILVFDSENDTYLYRTYAMRQEGTLLDFKAPLSQGNGKTFRFVFLANCREELTGAGDPGNSGKDLPAFAGLTRKEVLAKIHFTVDADGWNTSELKPFRPLPMWGTSEALAVGNNGITDLGTVRMLRSVVRIDVGANITAIDPNGVTEVGGLPHFQIEQVKVYNVSSGGRIAPTEENLDAPIPNYAKVVAISPAAAGGGTLTASYRHATAGNGFIREIYVPETFNHDEAGAPLEAGKQCFLLIGAYYRPAADPHNMELTWYRVDFYPKGDATNNPELRFDLLRNHCYTINVRSVEGPGFSSPEEAALSKPDNIDVEVIPWDGDSEKHIVSDGKHYLTVDREEIKLFFHGNPQSFITVTDFAGGWKAEVVGSAKEWLEVTPASGDADVPKNLLVSASKLDNLLTERTGEISVTAGRLKKIVRVVQTNDTDGLRIEPDLLVFRKSAPMPKQAMVSTKDSELSFTETGDAAGSPSWLIGGFPADGITGPFISFQPTVNNTGRVLNSLVTVYTTADNGSILSATLKIKQLPTDVVFNTQVDNPYPVQGGNCQFMVTEAETPWQIVSATPQDVLKVIDNKVRPAGTGQVYPFYLHQNLSWEDRQGLFHVTSSDPDFVPQDVAIIQAGNVPVLKDFSPAEADFTVDDNPQKVEFSVNCDWTATPQDRWVTADPASGNGGLPYQPERREILLYPASLTGENGIPHTGVPATGTYAGKVRFTTQNHGTHSAINVDYPYKRTVPAYFTYNSISPNEGSTLPWGGGTVTVNVSTNNNWSLKCAQASSTTVSATADTYGQKSLRLTIPANYGNARTITIELYNGNTKVRTFTMTQAKTQATLPSITQAYVEGDRIQVDFSSRPLMTIQKVIITTKRGGTFTYSGPFELGWGNNVVSYTAANTTETRKLIDHHKQSSLNVFYVEVVAEGGISTKTKDCSSMRNGDSSVKITPIS